MSMVTENYKLTSKHVNMFAK